MTSVDTELVLSALFVVVRLLRRPRDPKRVASMIDQMSKVASSPVIAIVAAGATLANPGALIAVSPDPRRGRSRPRADALSATPA
jgi:hypothetical protein